MRLPNMVELALLAGLGLSGCAHSGSGAADDDDDSLSELREHHSHHHRGGVTQFIAMSLDTLGEDDAQRPQVETLQKLLNACMGPTVEIEARLTLAYADGIASGAIDNSKLQEAIAALNSASGTVYECSADGLNQLHQLLTPAEREVVADKVQAHWEIWREVNDGPAVGNREKGSRLEALADELTLSAGQQDQMSAALGKAFGVSSKFEVKKAEAHVLAFAAAFVFATFDARKISPDENGRLSAHGAWRMALFYETITPFLKADQRATLAEHLREHAKHPITLSAN